MPLPDPTTAHRTIEALWRIESPKLIAALARLVRDVGFAEELAQDAFLIALEQWPHRGIPDDPGPWLMATAKHRAIDALRRQRRYQRKLAELGHELAVQQDAAVADLATADDRYLDDDLLGLLFTACHPVLSTDSRVTLILRVLCGLTTHEIARALLLGEPTVAQRIVRAKRTLARKRVTFALPPPEELPARLPTVLEVIYLLFNEGYAATAGRTWARPELCAQALRLGRVLAGLLPEQAEAQGLVALMELQASRLPARADPVGEPVLLPAQDRRRWDRLLIRRGLAALTRAEALDQPSGPYTLQAAIAACHARARTWEETDWERIAGLYQILAHISPSPVVELNRAVAVGLAWGPEQGLALVDGLAAAPALASYPQLPAVRGDLLARLGRSDEAAREFTRAAALTRNSQERAIFERRAATEGAAIAGGTRDSG